MYLMVYSYLCTGLQSYSRISPGILVLFPANVPSPSLHTFHQHQITLHQDVNSWAMCVCVAGIGRGYQSSTAAVCIKIPQHQTGQNNCGFPTEVTHMGYGCHGDLPVAVILVHSVAVMVKRGRGHALSFVTPFCFISTVFDSSNTTKERWRPLYAITDLLWTCCIINGISLVSECESHNRWQCKFCTSKSSHYIWFYVLLS